MNPHQARTFPCEAFSRKDGNFVKGQHLYKLLRPELVRSNDVPLSSDAFSAWGIGDRESVIEVQQATYRLFNVVIPELRDAIDKLPVDSFNEQQLITMMHQAGVNVRHLGRLRTNMSVWREIFSFSRLFFFFFLNLGSLVRDASQIVVA